MLKPSLQLRLTQSLTMTPQLQQAIRLLQLPIMELQTQIQEALDDNVMLEVEESENLETPEALEPEEPEPEDGEDFSDVAVASEADWGDVQKTGPSEAPKSS
ncbi:MAG TPA: RNA polymerase factor sigma-54, partial [Gammaproteobacteria bacterium]|nr:RNA polymerase factor sigma-54 [Gammaproteobacteria bacterium]